MMRSLAAYAVVIVLVYIEGFVSDRLVRGVSARMVGTQSPYEAYHDLRKTRLVSGVLSIIAGVISGVVLFWLLRSSAIKHVVILSGVFLFVPLLVYVLFARDKTQRMTFGDVATALMASVPFVLSMLATVILLELSGFH